MKSILNAIGWFSLLCLVFGEIRENRSSICDMSGDNCEKRIFEQFQVNGTTTKVNTTFTNKSNNNVAAVNTEALAHLITNQENGKKLICVFKLASIDLCGLTRKTNIQIEGKTTLS